MVRGTSDIITWFDNTNMPYWRIYPHKGIPSGNIIMQSRQEDGQSHGDALEDLKQKLRTIHRGSFTLVAFPDPNKLPTKGYQYTDVEIPQSEPQQAMISGPSGISPEDVKQQINAALNAYKSEQQLEQMKKEMADLKKENRELKASIDTPWNKLIGVIAPHSDKIIGHIFPTAAAVAGFPPADKEPVDNHIQEAEVVQESELTPEQSTVISEFISTLAEADPDWLATLKKLTTAIKAKPSLITMVKNFV